jgi:Fe-S cluster biogenesis protein NfuA
MTAMADEITFEARARRIDAARRAADALDAPARAAATELADALDAHQASVLRTIVRALRADDRGRELLYEVVDDPEVHAALVKAGIVRPTLAMRALQVLEGLRPYITSHGGDIELVRIDEGVAYVRLLGACQGCGSSTATLRDMVAEALLEHLPELHEVQEAAPEPTVVAPAFIPVGAVTVKRKATEPA